MLDFRIISDRLGKEYPWLSTNKSSDKNYIKFSIKANSFSSYNLCLLNIETVLTTKGQQLVLTGPVLNENIQFPSSHWVRSQQKIFKRTLKDNQADYEWCYNIINEYMPKIKEAIDWYNSINADYVEMTLKDLGFKEYIDGWHLHINDITVTVILPLADLPCFRANVQNEDGYFKDGWAACYTFDELLDKLIEEKGE